jgi:hypothetical protein
VQEGDLSRDECRLKAFSEVDRGIEVRFLKQFFLIRSNFERVKIKIHHRKTQFPLVWVRKTIGGKPGPSNQALTKYLFQPQSAAELQVCGNPARVSLECQNISNKVVYLVHELLACVALGLMAHQLN